MFGSAHSKMTGVLWQWFSNPLRKYPLVFPISNGGNPVKVSFFKYFFYNNIIKIFRERTLPEWPQSNLCANDAGEISKDNLELILILFQENLFEFRLVKLPLKCGITFESKRNLLDFRRIN